MDLQNLKQKVEAGYYRTEESEGLQTLIPWANKTCQDCPFFRAHAEAVTGACILWGGTVSRKYHTCAYFDPCNFQDAQYLVKLRQLVGHQEWTETMREMRVPLDEEPARLAR